MLPVRLQKFHSMYYSYVCANWRKKKKSSKRNELIHITTVPRRQTFLYMFTFIYTLQRETTWQIATISVGKKWTLFSSQSSKLIGWLSRKICWEKCHAYENSATTPTDFNDFKGNATDPYSVCSMLHYGGGNTYRFRKLNGLLCAILW